MNFKKTLISTLVLSSIAATAVAHSASPMTAIHIWNNGDTPATIKLNDHKAEVVQPGQMATPLGSDPKFTIEFNPGQKDHKAFTCKVFSQGSNPRDGAKWLEGTTATVEINNNIDIMQYDASVNNPNNNSAEFVKAGVLADSGLGVYHCHYGK